MADKRGWGFPANSRKAHYFNNDVVSLCGKWMYAGERNDTMHDHPQNCKECMKKREKLPASQPVLAERKE